MVISPKLRKHMQFFSAQVDVLSTCPQTLAVCLMYNTRWVVTYEAFGRRLKTIYFSPYLHVLICLYRTDNSDVSQKTGTRAVMLVIRRNCLFLLFPSGRNK
jgi:hypothetical protein